MLPGGAQPVVDGGNRHAVKRGYLALRSILKVVEDRHLALGLGQIGDRCQDAVEPLAGLRDKVRLGAG